MQKFNYKKIDDPKFDNENRIESESEENPEEESFAVFGQMGDVRWNQLAEKKGKNSEFQFSKERLFFF